MTTIKVEGMSCEHCVQSVTKALESIPGLENIHVDLQKKQAQFTSQGPVSMDLVHAAIRKIGFESSDMIQ
jgi:copper chaperone